MLKLPGRKAENYEMSPGVRLANGHVVSGLISRADISPENLPKPAHPRRPSAPKAETIPFAITGGEPNRPAQLMGIDPKTRKLLKFADPKTDPPRGYTGPNRGAADYLPKPIGNGGAQFINLVGGKLPGKGGISRTVIRIDPNDKTPPIFEVYARRDAQSRQLYLPGKTDPKSSLVFLPGRLRGAGRYLGTLYIAVPNLSPLPVPRRK
jgi:hypothetical protein